MIDRPNYSLIWTVAWCVLSSGATGAITLYGMGRNEGTSGNQIIAEIAALKVTIESQNTIFQSQINTLNSTMADRRAMRNDQFSAVGQRQENSEDRLRALEQIVATLPAMDRRITEGLAGINQGQTDIRQRLDRIEDKGSRP